MAYLTHISEIRYFVHYIQGVKDLEIASGESGKEALRLILTEKESLESGNKARISP